LSPKNATAGLFALNAKNPAPTLRRRASPCRRTCLFLSPHDGRMLAQVVAADAWSRPLGTWRDEMKSAFGLIAATVLAVGCGTPPQSTTPPATAYSPQAYSNLAQLMRGIPFTFANIVFDAQSEDPGAARDPAAVGGGATATFKNVYGGWQEVENSALALSEAANLILVPGRLCENGRPVPLDQADFRAAAEGLAEAGRAAYKAAQSKNMDEMVTVSETVAASCSKCHEPYRDFDDPKDRCKAPAARAE
jgi:hypothetical protein